MKMFIITKGEDHFSRTAKMATGLLSSLTRTPLPKRQTFAVGPAFWKTIFEKVLFMSHYQCFYYVSLTIRKKDIVSIRFSFTISNQRHNIFHQNISQSK